MLRSGAMRCVVVAGVALAWSLDSAGFAVAGEFEATLTTLISGRQDPRDDQVHTVVPMYELISVRATDVANPWIEGLRVVIGGWVRVDPGDPADDDLGTGDVGVAYVEGTLLDERLQLRAGRQLVFGGGARGLQHDGLSATYRVWRRLGATAYGGHPVTPRFVADRGDAVAGTRVFWAHSATSEMGVSFIRLQNDGLVDRQDVGVDARYALKKNLVATAYGLWSTLENRPAEVDLGVQWQPSKTLRLAGDYRLTAPDLFLPRGSILSVFSEEQRQEAGASLWIRPRPRLRFELESYGLRVEEGSGGRGRARATMFLDKQFETRVGAEARVLHIPSNGYQQGRLYITHRASAALNLGFDADAYHFEEEINGELWSFTGTASASYAIRSKWHVTVVGLGGVTPFLERRLEVMGKLTYGRIREVRRSLP